jgi:hypothetical protein
MKADNSTKLISPSTVLQSVASAIPNDFKHNIIIVGSLAAGYYFFADNPKLQVRTKDVDCLLSPRIEALLAGEAVADRLFAENWQLRTEGEWNKAGDELTPLNQLPVVRLHPPDSKEWFIELLTVPESETDLGRKDIRLTTTKGHFSLCSFGFLSLAEYDPIKTSFGIAIARPETMALANLLHHPTIGKQTMSGLIQGREIKRSNKDLGRVLALAYLAESKEDDALLKWPSVWLAALKARFPTIWSQLIPRVGSGIREILDPRKEADLGEALHTCQFGLLASYTPTLNLLKVTAERLLVDAIEPLEKQT